ncbi:hypothetical protein Q3G72_004211 [Acer saccharum]|nr:hypothetical protein Q3G72_004211 [Acer saccharum]
MPVFCLSVEISKAMAKVDVNGVVEGIGQCSSSYWISLRISHEMLSSKAALRSFDEKRNGFCFVVLNKLELERLSWLLLRLGITFAIFVVSESAEK